MPRLTGLKEIGAHLGLNPRRVEQLAVQPVDPLPLRLLGRAVWILSDYLEQWEARRRDLQRLHAARGAYGRPSLPVLVGRRAIAARAGVTVKQVERWTRFPGDPLPVRGRDRRERLPGGLVWIYDAALRDWLQRRDRPYSERARRKPMYHGDRALKYRRMGLHEIADKDPDEIRRNSSRQVGIPLTWAADTNEPDYAGPSTSGSPRTPGVGADGPADAGDAAVRAVVVIQLLRAVVEALPRCGGGGCRATATRTTGLTPLCDVHAPPSPYVVDLPYADALRKLLAG